MPFQPGDKLGPYEILAPLGAGGMGEVYKARDTRLDRVVAVKVLPTHIAARDDLRQRFEREARAVSSLNHPHICTLHDVGREGDIDYMVMEHLEGETLYDRLQKGPLALDQALKYAQQIADAVDRAHRSGVVHRDLKPGNIMLTRDGAKVLDFGLAKSAPKAAPDGATLTAAITTEGTILGTPQYMSPEQIEGLEADSRSDIFALGCVLYEMVTGKRAFDGKTKGSVIAAILAAEPQPLRELAPGLPERLDHILKACLAKDPDERWQSAADLRREIQWLAIASDAPPASPRKLAWLPWALAVLLPIATALVAIRFAGSRDPAEPVAFDVTAPEGWSFMGRQGGIAVSPDGQRIALVASSASKGEVGILVKELDSLAFRTIVSGFDQVSALFWSPDNGSLGFHANGALRVAELASGTTRELSKLDRTNFRGAAWGSLGDIVYAPDNFGALRRFRPGSQSGNALDPKADLGGNSQTWPSFLPNGKDFLFTSARGQQVGLFAGTLGAMQVKRLATIFGSAQYAGGSIFYLRERNLVARPFDLDKLDFTGEETLVAQNVPRLVRYGMFSASDRTLAFAIRTREEGHTGAAWVDASGKREIVWTQPSAVDMNPSAVSHVEVSPDGRRLVFTRDWDLSIRDIATGVESRFTFDPGAEAVAAWSPDGAYIFWVGQKRGQPWQIFRKRSNGAGQEEQLTSDREVKHHLDVTKDGEGVVYECGIGAATQICLYSFRDRSVRRLSGPDTVEFQPRLSPDGRWLAYSAHGAGPMEVYVRAFPSMDGPWEVSQRGGSAPRWSPDGKTIFYLNAIGELVSVEVSTAGGAFRVGGRKTLLATVLDPLMISSHFTVSHDGKQFLLPVAQSALQFRVIVNWREWLSGRGHAVP